MSGSCALFLTILLISPLAGAGDFGAYYTSIEDEEYSRTGPQADIIVDLGDSGKLVFWRGSSYLPYWETSRGKWYVPEILPRQGDGEGIKPDRVNTYSRVAIIESSAERTIVHWRYLPRFGGTNPHTSVHASKFADEYFTITPDGAVLRTIKEGTARIQDWEDPRNRRVQKLKLTPRGIEDLGVTGPASSGPPGPARGNPLRTGVVGKPCRYWKFDEAAGEEAVESVKGIRCAIQGPGIFWKKGVSGTALHFDGYNSVIRLPAKKAPEVQNGLTLEAWTSGAYPWNWCPIVQQGDEGGYFLGVGGHALAVLRVQVGDSLEEIRSATKLERNRWYHLAGTFDGTSGTLRLYIDGKESGSKTVTPAAIRMAREDIKIGQGGKRRPVDPVRRNTFSDFYSFDGLIDEVKIYDVALDPEQVARSCRNFQPPIPVRDHPDMDRRLLPTGKWTGKFGARYTHLKFYETWDAMWRLGDHPDVVVDFDRLPGKFVFWRGTCFIPMMVNERGQWYSNEFNETWGTSGGRGCQEPMSDKEGLTNHVRIIENTDARVVVHWRYPLIDVFRVTANFHPETGWGDWSDWYYYIYPDGVAVKRMRLWTHGNRNHEWQESMAIFGPDQHPEEIIEKKNTLTLADLDGNHKTYHWETGPPRIPGREFRGKCIQLVNYRGRLDPFTIGEFQGGDVYGGELTPYAVFPTWNHWPVAQMPSDGRYASFPDRTAHSSLTHLRLPVYREGFGKRPFQEKLLMEGLTDKSASGLAPLARSWLRAPELETGAGCKGGGYDPSQRAYPLIARAPRLSFLLRGSEASPVINPCFVIRNWGSRGRATMEVDGSEKAPGPDLRPGTIRDTDGTYTKILWLQMEASRPVEFAISGASPDNSPPEPWALQWRSEPRAGKEAFSIEMTAALASHPGGVEYYFEETGGQSGGRDSGWQRSPRFTASGLAPGTTYSYRVRARNRFHLETDWSPVKSATTGDPPGPAAHWKMDEGRGKSVKDSAGRRDGAMQGKVFREEGRRGQALRFDGEGAVRVDPAGDLRSRGNFTWTAWIRTREGGSIIARAGAGARWARGGKVLFVEDGRLTLDVGWVGAVESDRGLNDGEWHHVAVSVSSREGGDRIRFFVDGSPAGGGSLNVGRFPETDLPVKIGNCNENFPGRPGFSGLIDDVRWYAYALTEPMVRDLYNSR